MVRVRVSPHQPFIPPFSHFFFLFPGDQTGECRAHGNLGSAFFSKGNYREALTNHRNQLVLAMKLKDREVRNDFCGFGSNYGGRRRMEEG